MTSHIIYGTHACDYALQNPRRTILKAYTLEKTPFPFPVPKGVPVIEKNKDFFQKLGQATQDIALEVQPLINYDLSLLKDLHKSIVVILDQVSDPRNVGAIFRNAAAFGVDAIIMQDRHAPKENALMVKTACGGFDLVPFTYVTNIVHTMEELKTLGYWTYGLAEGNSTQLTQTQFSGKIALVFGSEDIGMRPLVKKHCDHLITIETSPSFSTLNVVNATAAVLHHIYGNIN